MDRVRAERMAGELLGLTIGSWTPVRLLDSGKSAMVFEAENGPTVGALKIFDPELVERFGSDVQAARIERELVLCGKEHPHLVRILDGGKCSRTHYFFVVMDLVAGRPLSKVLESVPRDRIWPLMSQVASAARFLEQLNLVHRDIKPDNVVVSDDFQHARLLDLGVIRPIGEPGLTDRDQTPFIGTLQYSSPEFLFRTEDDTPDGWRALTFYQLGALLHDLIMRERIFAAQFSPYAALVEAVKSLSPTVEAPDVPPDLLLLAKSCLCKDPELRLRLVRWEHFDPPSAQVVSVSVVEDRIRRREALASGAAAADRLAVMRAQAIKQTVEYARERVQGLSRKECVGSGLFPPVQVVDCTGQAENEIHFVLRFDASVDHALWGCLQVWVHVCLISQPSIVIRVSASSSLSAEPLPSTTQIPELRLLFEGPLDEAVLGPRMKRFLYSMLDQAQSTPKRTQVTEGTIVWLPLEQDEVAE
jgi:eukaryotic-like serine/threonine-protein kinase